MAIEILAITCSEDLSFCFFLEGLKKLYSVVSLGVKTPWGGLQDEREINNVWGFKGFDRIEGSQEGEKRTFQADKGMEHRQTEQLSAAKAGMRQE